MLLLKGTRVSKKLMPKRRESNSGEEAPLGDSTMLYVLFAITISLREISSKSYSLKLGPSVYCQKQFSASIIDLQKFLLVVYLKGESSLSWINKLPSATLNNAVATSFFKKRLFLV